jgi:hypothetical protein
MTQPTPPNEAQRLAAAFAEGLAQALQAPFVSLTTQLRLANEQYAEIIAALDRLTNTVAVLAAGDQDPDEAPDIQMPIERFHSFDWAQIGAQVLQEDEFGTAIVSYRGKAYKRRSPDNSYNPAIWFSRAIGKDDEGRNRYVRLITFKPMSDDVQPMGRKTERALASAPAPATQPPARQPAPTAAPPPAHTQTAAQAAPAATSAPAPRTPAQEPPPDEPPWLAGEQSAAAEFDSWPSASEALPSQPERPAPQVGPKISAGARGAETAAQPPVTGKTGPAPAPSASIRPATIGAGDAYKLFGKWAGEFAARYPYYAAGGRPNYPKLLASIAGVGQKTGQNFSHVNVDNLDAIKAAMEQHAAANHAN